MGDSGIKAEGGARATLRPTGATPDRHFARPEQRPTGTSPDRRFGRPTQRPTYTAPDRGYPPTPTSLADKGWVRRSGN